MKKVGGYLGITSLLTVLASTSVSAADTTQALTPIVNMASGAVNAAYNAIEPALALLVGESAGSTIFFGKLLIAILIFSVTYAVVSMSGFFDDKNKWVVWVAGIVVALLGVRPLTADWVETAMLPSSVFAVAMAAIIPLAAFGFIILKFRSRPARKASWILLGVTFLMLWAVRSAELGTAGTIYFLAAMVCLGMFAFDGTIKHWKDKMQKEKMMDAKKYGQYVRALKERDEKYDLYIDAVKRFGASDPKAITLKTDLDNLDTAIDNMLA